MILNSEALKAWILSKVVSLTNNLLANQPGVSALDAAQGPVIQGQIDELEKGLDEVNSNLQKMLQVHGSARYDYDVSLKSGTNLYTIDLSKNASYKEMINTGYVPYILNANVYSSSTSFTVNNLLDLGLSDSTIRVIITASSASTQTVRFLILWAVI